MQDKIYIIIESEGSYDDYNTRNLCAFIDFGKAEIECDRLNKELNDKKRINEELSEKYDKLLNKDEQTYTEEDIRFLEEFEYDYYLDERHDYRIQAIELIK